MALKNKYYTVSKVGQIPDETAPDGSEIRLLPRMTRGSLCECLLPVGKTSLANHIETRELLQTAEQRLSRYIGLASDT